MVPEKTFLSKIKSDPRSARVKDTIHIVAHSMGAAYAVGFVEAVKDEVYLGRFYILTPKNAYAGGNNWAMFEVALYDGANWGELQMHTVGAQWNTGATFPKPFCSNCEITFTGIEILQ